MPSTQSPILTQDNHTTPVLVYRKVHTQGLFKHHNHYPLVRALAFSPDGTLLGGAFERYVVIWRLESAEENDSPGGLENWSSRAMFTLNENAEEELCFFSWANADFLLIGSTYGSVKVGCYTDSVCHYRSAVFTQCTECGGVVKCATFKGFQASLYSIKFIEMHCGGSLLAVAAGDYEVTVWTLNEGGFYLLAVVRMLTGSYSRKAGGSKRIAFASLPMGSAFPTSGRK